MAWSWRSVSVYGESGYLSKSWKNLLNTILKLGVNVIGNLLNNCTRLLVIEHVKTGVIFSGSFPSPESTAAIQFRPTPTRVACSHVLLDSIVECLSDKSLSAFFPHRKASSAACEIHFRAFCPFVRVSLRLISRRTYLKRSKFWTDFDET